METEITVFYTVCDNMLKTMNFRDDCQARMNTAEVMTVVLTAARFFCGSIRTSAVFLSEHGYIPDMLSESRLNRRIHATDESAWENLFLTLADIFKAAEDGEHIIGSFPVPVCDNIRIPRAKILRGEDWRGYMPSKRRYFYGIRVHMITTASGYPVEFVIAPGRDSDVAVLRQMRFDLPEGSVCHGDKIYNDYNYEDMLREAAGIILSPIRKKNSVRAADSRVGRPARQNTRKRIETTFGQITNFFPKKIHAVTPKGFFLKVISFIISFSFHCLIAQFFTYIASHITIRPFKIRI